MEVNVDACDAISMKMSENWYCDLRKPRLVLRLLWPKEWLAGVETRTGGAENASRPSNVERTMSMDLNFWMPLFAEVVVSE